MKALRLVQYIIVAVMMPAVFYMALVWVPPAMGLGDASRILYFHVPIAWSSVLAFLASGYYSIRFLMKENSSYELYAWNAAYTGLVYSVLTVITGSIWAHISWNIWWNWDPRETSAVILLLIYIAYISLYSSLKERPGRGKISAVYLVIAAVVMPFFVFIIPRIYRSLHPDMIFGSENKFDLEPSMRITLLTSIAVFTLLYFIIISLMNRASILEKTIGENIHDN
ncbi:MAG TPA: cytochrome c biogenesis protein [Spirochaetota bacterium]|nr:cytochrome c biogenesis protein [Spirochaetota bacterium]